MVPWLWCNLRYFLLRHEIDPNDTTAKNSATHSLSPRSVPRTISTYFLRFQISLTTTSSHTLDAGTDDWSRQRLKIKRASSCSPRSSLPCALSLPFPYFAVSRVSHWPCSSEHRARLVMRVAPRPLILLATPLHVSILHCIPSQSLAIPTARSPTLSLLPRAPTSLVYYLCGWYKLSLSLSLPLFLSLSLSLSDSPSLSWLRPPPPLTACLPRLHNSSTIRGIVLERTFTPAFPLSLRHAPLALRARIFSLAVWLAGRAPRRVLAIPLPRVARPSRVFVCPLLPFPAAPLRTHSSVDARPGDASVMVCVCFVAAVVSAPCTVAVRAPVCRLLQLVASCSAYRAVDYAFVVDSLVRVWFLSRAPSCP